MSNYWEKRAVQRMYDAMELAEAAADELGKIYLKASRYICNKSDDIFDKFRRKHNLSDAEARRLISRVQDKTSLDEIQRLVSESKSKNKELIPELESSAYRARLERLRQLQNELDLVMRNVYLQEKQYTTSFYTDLANEIFYKSIYDIQQRAGVAFNFDHISEKQINKVLSMDWSGQNYSKRIWKNTQGLAETVKEELLINLLTGRTNREVAEIIANKFASGAAKARRLVRTESNFISSELNHEAYKEAGIEEYQYLATLDLRTSEICRELDGKIFKVSERKVGVNCNPMHPWCRSTTIPVVDKEFLNDGTRSARNPVTGKVIKVPASMNYKEWYEKFVEGSSKAKVAEKKLKNKSADRKQYERYRRILGNNVPDNLDDFLELKYNDNEKWDELKKKYRVVNSYEANAGEMSPDKIYELDDKAFHAKQLFTGKARKQANIAIMEIDGNIKCANSQTDNIRSTSYINYRGDKSLLILKTEAPQFKTYKVGSHSRDVDSEAKLLEYAATIVKDGKSHTINLLSEKCMCDSCLSVLQQFRDKYPDVTINAVSNKKERAEKNKNKPWEYRKG